MGKIQKEISSTILLEVYRGNGLTMSQLQEKTKMSTITVLQHVNAMVDAGLLVEEREKAFPRRRLLRTSAEGKQVASLLAIAGETDITAQGLIEMGATAGRITAYKEAVELLRKPNFNSERAIAELLLKDLHALGFGMMLLQKSLPKPLAEKVEQLKRICAKIDELEREGESRLMANDLKGAMKFASDGFSTYNESLPLMLDIYGSFREKGLGELASYVDSISPKRIQKE